jgi:hypothetical protein
VNEGQRADGKPGHGITQTGVGVGGDKPMHDRYSSRQDAPSGRLEDFELGLHEMVDHSETAING